MGALMCPEWLVRFVAESNRIEGIRGEPHPNAVLAHEKLLGQEHLDTHFLCDWVHVVAGPHARLRAHLGMDVAVGGHLPPHGGHKIPLALEALACIGPTDEI